MNAPWPRSRRRKASRRRGARALVQIERIPLPMLLIALPSLPRPVLSRLTTAMIDRMDMMDGDPDIELNGDELDEVNAEDAFMDHGGISRGGIWAGAGCPISDPGEDIHDQEDDDERESEPYEDGLMDTGTAFRLHVTL